jgi:hypothetical protein
MGSVNFGIPKELVLFIKDEFQIANFVETGTFEGNTTVWASEHFQKCVTIENSKPVYERTIANHGHIAKIQFLFGNSATELKPVIEKLNGNSLFWLDGHWSGWDTYGEEDQCPILKELEQVGTRPSDFLLIDDARLFLAPPALPNRADQWPTVDEVISAIHKFNPEHYITVYEDVIVAAPVASKSKLMDYMQKENTHSWETWWTEAHHAKELANTAKLVKFERDHYFDLADRQKKEIEALTSAHDTALSELQAANARCADLSSKFEALSNSKTMVLKNTVYKLLGRGA